MMTKCCHKNLMKVELEEIGSDTPDSLSFLCFNCGERVHYVNLR